MRKIVKRQGFEPQSLTDWKRANPNKRYSQLKDAEVRQAIREEAIKEQYYLCGGHCCQPISGNGDCHNEHVEAQDLNSNRTLDFGNIIASCNSKKQCGDAHGSQALPLTPFMDECESDLVFKISGRVSGKTADAIETIRVLNLGDSEQNNKSLIEKRKALVHALLWKEEVNPEEGLEDDELIDMLIDEISTPKNGKLEPFVPVVVNILRQWIK
ncbi:TIGR02646 family protein [Vibrio sp. JC009]|uniref:TIGR02646 family protein n=1 Tax=Vibrio sp. JC009 TaxID=2912314 RepID=UPI0023B056E7|nr:TIGR02646 family protein [Vibrio sp. JC009]WED24355.1 TIGR02646 family protein [Vibrio sp. JC009]